MAVGQKRQGGNNRAEGTVPQARGGLHVSPRTQTTEGVVTVSRSVPAATQQVSPRTQTTEGVVTVSWSIPAHPKDRERSV